MEAAAGGQGTEPIVGLDERLARAALDAAEAARGRFFTDLDRLAFALELEASEALEAGNEDAAMRLEDQRLGVRLAQRLVSGVHADEVDQRLLRVRDAYELATGGPVT